MAKKQTRRSISVSRTTYERLKAFCETNNISMSQLVETRVNDFLGTGDVASVTAPSAAVGTAGFRPPAPRPAPPSMPATRPSSHSTGLATSAPAAAAAPGMTPTQPPHPQHQPPAAHPVPMTSAAARFAVEPPPPIIKPRQDTAAPKPAEKRPEQIFTF